MTNPLTARLRLLTSLDEDALTLLEQACTATRTFAAGTDIAPEGDHPEHLRIVLAGWAARYKLLSDGRRQLPALLVPGDLCDADGLMLRRVHSGVCALTECTVATVPHAQVRDLMERSPAIRDAFWWLLCVENAVSAEWSVGLGRRSAEERVAHLLCELLIRLWTVGLSRDNSYDLPLTQVALADALGLSTVHVNRVLMDLRARGLLTLEHRRLTIHDQAALKRLAGFDARYLHVEGLRPEQGVARH